MNFLTHLLLKTLVFSLATAYTQWIEFDLSAKTNTTTGRIFSISRAHAFAGGGRFYHPPDLDNVMSEASVNKLIFNNNLGTSFGATSDFTTPEGRFDIYVGNLLVTNVFYYLPSYPYLNVQINRLVFKDHPESGYLCWHSTIVHYGVVGIVRIVCYDIEA